MNALNSISIFNCLSVFYKRHKQSKNKNQSNQSKCYLYLLQAPGYYNHVYFKQNISLFKLMRLFISTMSKKKKLYNKNIEKIYLLKKKWLRITILPKRKREIADSRQKCSLNDFGIAVISIKAITNCKNIFSKVFTHYTSRSFYQTWNRIFSYDFLLFRICSVYYFYVNNPKVCLRRDTSL